MNLAGLQSEGLTGKEGRLEADDKSNPLTPTGTVSPPSLGYGGGGGQNEMGNAHMQFKQGNIREDMEALGR